MNVDSKFSRCTRTRCCTGLPFGDRDVLLEQSWCKCRPSAHLSQNHKTSMHDAKKTCSPESTPNKPATRIEGLTKPPVGGRGWANNTERP